MIQTSVDINSVLIKTVPMVGSNASGMTGEKSSASQSAKFDAVLAQQSKIASESSTAKETASASEREALAQLLAQLSRASQPQLQQFAQDPQAVNDLVSSVGSKLNLSQAETESLKPLANLAVQNALKEAGKAVTATASGKTISVANGNAANLETSGTIPGPKGGEPEPRTAPAQSPTEVETETAAVEAQAKTAKADGTKIGAQTSANASSGQNQRVSRTLAPVFEGSTLPVASAQSIAGMKAQAAAINQAVAGIAQPAATLSSRTQVLGDSSSVTLGQAIKDEDNKQQNAVSQAMQVQAAQSGMIQPVVASATGQVAQAPAPAQAEEGIQALGASTPQVQPSLIQTANQAPAQNGQAQRGERITVAAGRQQSGEAQKTMENAESIAAKATPAAPKAANVAAAQLPEDMPVIEAFEISQAAPAATSKETQSADNAKNVSSKTAVVLSQTTTGEQTTAAAKQAEAEVPASEPAQAAALKTDAALAGTVKAEPATTQPAQTVATGELAQATAAKPQAQSAAASTGTNAATPKRMQASEFKLLREIGAGFAAGVQAQAKTAVNEEPMFEAGFKNLADSLIRQQALRESVVNQVASDLDGLRQASQIRIQLKPESLGKVEVSLVSDGNKLTATIVAATPEVRDALASNLQTFKQALEQHGITVQEMSVSVRSDIGQGFSQQQQPQQQSWGFARAAAAPALVSSTAAQTVAVDLPAFSGRVSALA